MAAPMKRKHDEDVETSKRITLTDVSDKKLRTFLEWCNENDFCISPKVTVTQDGSCAQYGMIAVEDIAEGYCLFQVPRSCLLMPSNCDIADIIEEDKLKLAATNQWIPLLLSLLYEKTNSSSQWWPYLDLFPDFNNLDLPMFWESSEITRLLKGTGVDLAVERDLQMIQSDYEKLICHFFERHRNKLSDGPGDLEYFKRMVAFVMAYSFTEPRDKEKELENREDVDSDEEEDEEEQIMSPPMMVPLADALNHITQNNAKLTFGKEALKMVTTRAIKKGEEIYNTYGQVSNLHLMHMYGFAEPYPDNTNDVVEIPSLRLLEAAKELADESDLSLLETKWEFLIDEDVLAEDDIFVLGKDGIITDDTCVQSLKVLSMTKQEFEDHQEKEGWSDAESESSLSGECKLDLVKLPQIDARWKQLLKRMGELHLKSYPLTLEEDEEKMKRASSLPSRERYALFIAHGQKKLISFFINSCS